MKSIYRIKIFGIVQGVGFRPFASKLAKDLNVDGYVANKGSYVEIVISAPDEKCVEYISILKNNPPDRSRILNIDIKRMDDADYRYKVNNDFEIIESENDSGEIYVSPDISICKDCMKEMQNKNNRRYMHPFINCTSCGPRFSILYGIPYDRERTSMRHFQMCDECKNEYKSPYSRRYDAQPVCCNKCGPKLYAFCDKDIKAYGNEALKLARQAIMSGEIIAVKGTGGYHLCCDAKNIETIKRLRKKKNRPFKPFACMFKDEDSIKKYCDIHGGYKDILKDYENGPEKPILLLPRKGGGEYEKEIDMVVGGQPEIGVMLPYTPVHALLFLNDDDVDFDKDVLVMTSGNVSGAPVCIDEAEALEYFSDFCKVILSNNRDIRFRNEDSLVGIYKGKEYIIRRARGYAPLPLRLPFSASRNILALGGELKNSFCIVKNGLAYMSPYIGDLEDERTKKAYKDILKKMLKLFDIVPDVIICDSHPGYHSRRLAEKISRENNIEIFNVQHHYAHILSCMAENGCFDKVIGVAFDGTGYGEDGSIWGGEILLCDMQGFERIGHMDRFSHIGGDLAAKEGYRIAVSLLNDIYGDDSAQICKRLKLSDEEYVNILKKMKKNNINTISSSSMGRIFDAVAAILGICNINTFEGEAAVRLENEAGKYNKQFVSTDVADRETYDIPIFEILDKIVMMRLANENVAKCAYEFHNMIASEVVRICKKAGREYGINICALSGGVFQNRLLLNMCEEGLKKDGFNILIHHRYPANDGGIALGQAIAAFQQ